jgi:flagellar basal-body rod modification protein FlgD
MELSRASSYVGHTVTIRTRLTTGEFREIEGRVDFVVYENNKAFLSIDGSLYRAEDVYAVVDPQYKLAYDLAMAFAISLNMLPSLENLTLADADKVDNLMAGYATMTPYQQEFVANELLQRLLSYVTRISELRALADNNTPPPDDDTPPVDGDDDDVPPVDDGSDGTDA